MGLLEDAKNIVLEIFGPEVANQLNDFESPEKEPEEFLKECIFFIGRLIGDDAAEKKFAPLIKKYLKTKAVGASSIPGYGSLKHKAGIPKLKSTMPVNAVADSFLLFLNPFA